MLGPDYENVNLIGLYLMYFSEFLAVGSLILYNLGEDDFQNNNGLTNQLL